MSGHNVARVLGPDGNPIASPRRGLPAAIGRAYQGASLYDPDLSTWSTRNPSPQLAIGADRDALAARIHDLARNDGWASGGVSRQVDAIVGAGWRLSSKPNARALGIDEDTASELGFSIDAAWKTYAEHIDCICDASEHDNFGGLLALSIRHRIWDGEALAQIDWIRRPYEYCTAVQVIHPDRLSNPNNMPDTVALRGGVAIGPRSQPLGYYIREAHPGDAYFANMQMMRWQYVPRSTPWGRRNIVHSFERQAAGQVRGVSPLAPILKKIRMLGRYDEAELQAAILNAVLAAFITSPFDQEQLAEAMSSDLSPYQKARLDFHKDAPISLPGVKVNFLSPGEQVQFTAPHHPNAVYEAYERTVLRNIATAIGVSYEQLSMDWSQVNYSSARAGLIEVWRGFNARKDNFAAQFAQPIYAAWLEEAIDRGDIKLPKGAPKFQEAKTAYCNAKWAGPPRGWVDPQKEALASVIRMEAGLSTLEDECLEQGKDWQEVLAQQARERKERKRLGLPEMIPQKLAKDLQPASAESGDLAEGKESERERQ